MPVDQIGRTLNLAFDFSGEYARAAQLMAKYADVPMSPEVRPSGDNAR